VHNRFIEDDVIERYLLGELSTAEQPELEQRYFTDPEFLRRIEAVEDDLIDSYVRRELEPARRERFESHFLVPPGRRERVRMAAALLERLDDRADAARSPAPPRRSYARVSALIAASLLLAALLTVVWLWMENRAMRSEMRLMRSARARAEANERALRSELERRTAAQQHPDATVVPPLPHAALEIVTAVLLPGLTRDGGGEVAAIELTPETGTVRLEAVLENSAPESRFDAEVRRAGGAVIWSGHSLAPRRAGKDSRLVLAIPRDRLGAGEYTLTLTSPDLVADYSFIVLPDRR
jgi:hypothetical protein